MTDNERKEAARAEIDAVLEKYRCQISPFTREVPVIVDGISLKVEKFVGMQIIALPDVSENPPDAVQ